MAKQAINIGTLANDGTGDTLRASLDKCNDNFDELYALTDGTGAASVLTLAAGSTSLGDTTIADATPILIFKDSSCTDADNNATITVNATATGTNAENIDVILASQVGGVATTFLNADADGSITLGDGTRAVVLSGAVTSGDVSISDATPVLNFTDSSCAVARVNALIKADATDTGDGTEDIDVTFQQMVAGAATTFLVSDADGSLTVGKSGQTIVFNGPVADTLFRSAAPTLSFTDSSCADGDVSFDIVVSATDATSTAEDIDVTFAAQVAGTKVSFLYFDADGRLALGYNGQVVHVAQLVHGNTVTAVTTTAAPASTDSGTLYTNEGDSDGATITLPAAQASPSLIFKFYVQAAQTLTITAGTADTIRIGSSVTAAAGSITSSTVGSSVTLECINATEWIATSSVGSWSL